MRLPLAPLLIRSESGSTAVEFALTAPILFAMLFGAMEGGRYLFQSAVLAEATGRGARCPALRSTAAPPPDCRSPAGMAVRIALVAHELGSALPVDEKAVQLQTAPCGILIKVEVDYRPLLIPHNLWRGQLRSLACVPE